MVDEMVSISEFHSVGARGRYLTHPSLAATTIGRDIIVLKYVPTGFSRDESQLRHKYPAIYFMNDVNDLRGKSRNRRG
jgi:hypothetical protein